jgi:tetratricopeptide (TPR) repeat protein/GNAT superfamily N-acetyltransferase
VAIAFTQRDCTRATLARNVTPLEQQTPSELAATAQNCVAAATTSARGASVPIARFYAGKAYRLLGDHEEAIRNLEAAANSFPDFGRSYQGWVDEAHIELSRTYQARGDFAQAFAQLNAVGSDGPAVKYERASILMRSPSGYEAAFEDLAIFANSNEFFRESDAAVVSLGRARLIELALTLGRDAIGAGAPSDENAQRAIRFYSRAGDAARAANWSVPGVDTTDIFVQLGTAHLWAAGLSAASDGGGLVCTPTPNLSASALYNARNAFQEALNRDPASANANWGMGCAIQASARRPEDAQAALPYLRRGSGGSVRNRLALARAEAASGSWSDARANFVGTVGALPTASERSRVYVEIANTYLRNEPVEDARGRPEDMRAAREQLDLALGQDDGNQLAYLLRGQVRYFLGDQSGADSDLRQAVRDNTPNQAAANYVLSLIQTDLWRRAPGETSRRRYGSDAVRYADLAYDGDRDNDEYRLQACLARIIFQRTQDGRAYCEADERREDYALSLVYEGIFYLREAYRKRGVAQQDDLARALRAFQRGTDWLDSNGQSPIVEGLPVRDLLNYGERVALYCGGLGGADPLPPTPAPRQFFVDLGYERCRPSR